jgi:putative Holliday junction resolvase
MSLDVGDAKIGTAMSDPMRVIATPLGIITRRDDFEAIRDITDLVKEHQVSTVVVGLPLDKDGNDSEQAKKIRQFTENLKKLVEVPVVYWNESFSTQAAQQMMRENSGKKRITGEDDDAVAAAIILQEYLDATMHINLN